MKLVRVILSPPVLSASGLTHDVRHGFDRTAEFPGCRTCKWVEIKDGDHHAEEKVQLLHRQCWSRLGIWTRLDRRLWPSRRGIEGP